MKYKLLFLLVFLPTLLFSQGNFNLEYQYNYSSNMEWLLGITKMKKNNNVYHIITKNSNTLVCKFINGNTHNLDYTLNANTGDSTNIALPDNGSIIYQYLSLMDVNNDDVYDFCSVIGNKISIVNSVNGQILKTLNFNGNTGAMNFKVVDIDADGYVELICYASNAFYIYSTPSTVYINENTTTVPDFKLKQNYPNPFNPTTKIDFSISKNASVKLVLYDINGKEVSTLLNESRKAGSYSETINGNNLSTGTYFYQLTVDGIAEAKKMILIK